MTFLGMEGQGKGTGSSSAVIDSGQRACRSCANCSGAHERRNLANDLQDSSSKTSSRKESTKVNGVDTRPNGLSSGMANMEDEYSENAELILENGFGDGAVAHN